MKVFVVTWNYSDGSPALYTSVQGVFSSRERADAAIGGRPVEVPTDTGSWFEVVELSVDAPFDKIVG